MSATPEHKDRIITDGFPEGWHIQDRRSNNTALLCRRSDFAIISNSICICTRPKAMPTDEWLDMARMIARGFEKELACRNSSTEE